MGTGSHLPIGMTPMVHRLGIEVPRPAEGNLTQKLIDKGRRMVQRKTIKGGSKHCFRPPGDRPGQPALRQTAKNVFFAKTSQLPARMQPSQKSEYLFIQKRI